jgi:hypothetical protein
MRQCSYTSQNQQTTESHTTYITLSHHFLNWSTFSIFVARASSRGSWFLPSGLGGANGRTFQVSELASFIQLKILKLGIFLSSKSCQRRGLVGASMMCFFRLAAWFLLVPKSRRTIWSDQKVTESSKLRDRKKLIWVCLKIVYPYTQWLMIIIPIKWL